MVQSVTMSPRLLSFAAALTLAACSSTPPCSPETCAGCCSSAGKCEAGTTADSCGSAGSTCVVCPSGQQCVRAFCSAAGGGTGGGGGGGDGGTGGGAGGGTGGGSGAYGFETTYAVWVVPSLLFNEVEAATAPNFWSTVDLTGDGRPDLVHTADPTTGQVFRGVIATNSWRVYPNTMTGFGALVDYGVPDPGNAIAEGFFRVTNLAGTKKWMLIDLDGTGAPELVHTANPATGNVWTAAANGAPEWRVYRALPTAFGAVSSWAVPASGVAEGFSYPFTSLATPRGSWGTLDVNGDRRADLVQTSNPANNAVFPGPVWRVFPSAVAATGFSTTATAWSVPDAGAPATTGFSTLNSAASPNFWATIDLNGDGRADFVHTADPATGRSFNAAGADSWRVYLGTPTGFSPTATTWPVPTDPAGMTALDFNAITGGTWTTLDLDGDKRPDLVSTADPATGRVWTDTMGRAEWRVYLNTGSGFQTAATSWRVPDSGTVPGFTSTASATGRLRWATIDLTGDGKPELVHTADPNTGMTWTESTRPIWRVYRQVQ